MDFIISLYITKRVEMVYVEKFMREVIQRGRNSFNLIERY